jgi:hypothetical protein
MRFVFAGRARWIALVVAVGGLAAGGIAWAAIPDSNGVIHGCYAKTNGTLRVIDSSSQNCDTKKEVALNWNQTGPKGATGAEGPTGPKGDTGDVGPTGAGAGETKALEMQPGAAVTLFDLAEIGTITESCVVVGDPGSEVDLQWTYTNTSGGARMVQVTRHNGPGSGRSVIQDGDSWSLVEENLLDDRIVIIAVSQSSMPWADVTITGSQPSYIDPSCVLLAHASTGD